MFNNCDADTNGELTFYNYIKDRVDVIFDVGCRVDTLFLEHTGTVHYFDPVEKFINELKQKPTRNRNSFYNAFGLGNETQVSYYYPRYQSFYDREISCKVSDSENKIMLLINKAEDYVKNSNIDKIDFLKIDTEGYELNVLRGFGSTLSNVGIIQFEYGGTFLDNKVKLKDVIDYLKSHGFEDFWYLVHNGIYPVADFSDHYQYCNIVTVNKNNQLKELFYS